MAKYWPADIGPGYVDLELRANIALRLIEQNTATIAGKTDGEDSAGRARVVLQPPGELVTRCFEIADTFIDTAEKRGDIRPASAEEWSPRARLRRSLEKLDKAAGLTPPEPDAATPTTPTADPPA